MTQVFLRATLLLVVFVMLSAGSCVQMATLAPGSDPFTEGFRAAVADHQQGRGYNNPTNPNVDYIAGYKAGFAHASELAAREVFGGVPYKMGGGDGGAGDGGI